MTDRRTGSLADKAVVEKLLKERDTAGQDIRKAEAFDLKKIDNPQEKEVLAEFDRRRKARNLTLPTDDVQVKLMLRRCNEPICLFGEDILDRRERLRTLLSKLSEDEVHMILHSWDEKEKPDAQMDTCTWYHRGPEALRDARVDIADFSLRRAAKRLERAREQAKLSQQEKALIKQETHKWIQNVHIYGSQVSGIRATSFSEFSPNSEHIITSNWSGQVSIWTVPDCNEELRLIGHSCQVGCARFRPGAYTTVDPLCLSAASCDHEGRVLLWNLRSEQPHAELEKHPARVSRLAFHPSGNYLATCCFDASWRLYDLETLNELLFQEGHNKGVFDVGFQTDGSLALTGGLDCYGRVWDLRTGRCIMFLEGHQKAIHTVCWHPNGYIMITGSADNSCKVWDVRMRRCMYTMPAHQNLVSRVKIDPTGEYMVSSSYDNTLKLWTTTGYQPLKILEGHDMKVMSVDISPNGKWISSTCYDRTFKMWTSQQDL
ncbi:WD domain, g-beta repeat domain-containing protein [Ditylenchus destructor]|uniref:WD domain, g-beta repeat domain-containing protein n=1 Tax=Ditylenchus destructor TaxID=166010 RepID=A0AAD4NAB9_9BILA|nr:WD domain, g-beta repeat domain-containing protein [Ditylenchus destructor]